MIEEWLEYEKDIMISNLGNVIKYITRADHKGSRYEDLLKALWYLTRELGRKS